METIFALATARGKSGVAVIRVSGPNAHMVGTRLAGSLPEPGRHALRTIRREDGELLDRGLLLCFRAPASFTGEDCVEFHLHGSVAVVSAVEREIIGSGLARPAAAGEFTRRALANGKLDLSQVEALGDLLAAETEAQRRQAVRGLEGGLAKVVAEIRQDLLRAKALLEVTIDFVDEDVPVDVMPEVLNALASVEARLSEQISGSIVAERIRSGFEIALVGPPNAGKSSLLNYIARREVAITSHHAGTTRDIIEVFVDLDGLPVTFLDTAGLRETTDEVENIGMDRTRRRAREADLTVLLSPVDGAESDTKGVACDIVLQTKIDLVPGTKGVSIVTGDGVGEFLEHLRDRLQAKSASVHEATNLRQRAAMLEAKSAVEGAQALARRGDVGVELIAESVRLAADTLSAMIGAVGVEDVLGAIFSEFCIGK